MSNRLKRERREKRRTLKRAIRRQHPPKSDELIDYFAPMRRTIIEGNTYVCEPKPDEREVFEEALRYARPNQVNNIEFNERDVKHIMVNHIRHNGTYYENNLRRMYDNVPGICQEHVHAMLKNATLHEIGQAYPYLADACMKQKIRVNLVNNIKKG